MSRALFWECPHPSCGFRFPEVGPQAALPAARTCPRCGTPLRLVAQISLPGEAPPPPSPASPHPLPPPHPGARLGVLDNLRSAWNVGSIFRSADGAGWAHVALAGFSPDPTHPGVAKTALGAERHLPWSRHLNAVRLVQRLKAQGWLIWALETHPQAVPLQPGQAMGVQGAPLALVVGNEQAGVDPGVLELCHRVVALPMRGLKRSLNVAVAFAVAAYLLAPPGGDRASS